MSFDCINWYLSYRIYDTKTQEAYLYDDAVGILVSIALIKTGKVFWVLLSG